MVTLSNEAALLLARFAEAALLEGLHYGDELLYDSVQSAVNDVRRLVG